MTLLQQKLEMNSERRFRDDLIPKLPDSLRIIFEHARAIHSKELFSALEKSPFPQFEDGSLVTKEDYDLYLHLEYDQIPHIERILNESRIYFAPPVAIHLGKGPVYLVDRPVGSEIIIHLCSSLLDQVASHIYIANNHQGVIIDSYCGYLPDDRSTSKDEIVYEFTYYQDAEQGGALDALTRASDL